MREAAGSENSPPASSPADTESAGAGMLSLVLDVGLPVGMYYLLSKGFGMSTMAALAWSSVPPALRTGWSVLVRRSTNRFALTVLIVTLVGLALSLWAGDARLMLAKDSGATGALSLAVLVSTLRGTPLMSAALKPWLVKGDPARNAAWQRLSASSRPFQAAERRYSVVWGLALLAESVLRVIGAYTLPVDFMVWFSTVILSGCVVVAVAISTVVSTKPMERMVVEAAGSRAHVGGGAHGGGAHARRPSK